MTCELRQISPAYAQWLLRNPDEIFQYYEQLQEGELPKSAQGDDLDLDKAWHGLHYLLTGTAWGDEEPGCYLVLGGEQVGDEEEHVISYGPARVLLPEQVASFYQVVAALTPADLSARFNPTEMTELNIYPGGWNTEAAESEEWLQHSFAELQEFLQRTTARRMAIVTTIM